METDKMIRSWILTLPADEYDEDYVTEKLSKYVYVGQLELGGKTEYLHWQIYIENPQGIRFSTLRNKFPKGHFEKRRGSKLEAYNYVTKTETSQGVSIKNGEIDTADNQGERNDIYSLRSAILFEDVTSDDLILTDPRAARYSNYLRELEQIWKAKKNKNSLRTDIECRYLWGPAGCGKTRLAFETFGGDAYRVTDYQHPWDSYNDEQTIILDEFRGQLEFSFMLNALDIYPLRLPCRYRDRWANFRTVWVLSNVPLIDQYPNARGYNFAAFARRFSSVDKMELDGTIVPDSINVRR